MEIIETHKSSYYATPEKAHETAQKDPAVIVKRRENVTDGLFQRSHYATKQGNMIVTGLGQCSLDHIALADDFPREDSKMEASDFVIDGGGPTATALVALSRLGARTFFMGVVGADRAGDDIKRGLKQEGVDVSRVKVRARGNSQTAFIIVNTSKGTRTIIWQRPTAVRLRPAEVDAKIIQGSNLLLLDGLMPEASIRAAKIARASNVPILLDAGRLRPGMMELAALSDHIVASSEFSDDIAKSPEQALKKLSRLRADTITITLGSKGAITYKDNVTFRIPAFKIKAIDTTGAGDVFHGGYAWGLLNNWDIRKTIEFASALAAMKCSKPGGRAGIATEKKTSTYIHKNKS